MGTWRTLEHTADLALEAVGTTAEDALESLCFGLQAQISDPETVQPGDEVVIEASGFDAAETLVSALNEILYWINVKGWVFRTFEAGEVSTKRIRLSARGELRDPSRHGFFLEVKAATYHELFFGRDESGGWRARVLFDV